MTLIDAACSAEVRALFVPHSCHRFVSEFWERRHHLVRGSSAASDIAAAVGFAQLLRSEDLPAVADHWQFKVGQDHSQARMLRPNSFSHSDRWPEGTRVDGSVLDAALRDNHTDRRPERRTPPSAKRC